MFKEHYGFYLSNATAHLLLIMYKVINKSRTRKKNFDNSKFYKQILKDKVALESRD